MPLSLHCVHREGYSSQHRVHVVPSASTSRLSLEATLKVKGVNACSLVLMNEGMNS